MVGEIEERRSTLDEIRGRSLFVANAVRGWFRWRRWTARRCRTRETEALAEPFLVLTQPSDGLVFAARNGARLPAVVVAQSVRAPDCGSGGCGFKSRQPPW